MEKRNNSETLEETDLLNTLIEEIELLKAQYLTTHELNQVILERKLREIVKNNKNEQEYSHLKVYIKNRHIMTKEASHFEMGIVPILISMLSLITSILSNPNTINIVNTKATAEILSQMLNTESTILSYVLSIVMLISCVCALVPLFKKSIWRTKADFYMITNNVLESI